MPQSASAIEACSFARLLVLGLPKTGKSCVVTSTAPRGVYVINSDEKYSLRPVLDWSDEFEHDYVPGNDLREMEKAIHNAREGVKSGKYATIVWDTITEYVRRVEPIYQKASEDKDGNPVSFLYSPRLGQHIHSILDRLFDLPAHVIVNSHWEDMGAGGLPNQLPKKGQGIVPMLPGKLRKEVPRRFPNVVMLEKASDSDARIFITRDNGVFTLGCKNLPGVSQVPADISLLWERMTQYNNQPISEKQPK